MGAELEQLKNDVVSACRILSQHSLVEGFGHVSARIFDSDQFIITPRISLALVTEAQLLTMNLNGEVVAGSHPAPFEAALHCAIMKMKPQVNAIARIHARVAMAVSLPAGSRYSLCRTLSPQQNWARKSQARSATNRRFCSEGMVR